MNSKTIETLSIAVQALALSRSVGDILLTEEQKKQIPDLYRKHVTDIMKQFCENIGLPFEKLLSEISQVPTSDYPDNTVHHQLSPKYEDLQNDNTEVR